MRAPLSTAVVVYEMMAGLGKVGIWVGSDKMVLRCRLLLSLRAALSGVLCGVRRAVVTVMGFSAPLRETSCS
ncbi:hypothetical protein VTK73DRAFT_4628 [Phialemonium thermophilum]|uniref:Uncharacterized protein n=1 Tax=Phialemonium thermophilum TaxID=223376 RepID=A0ABR3V868_9PEZI